jgi:hypothetical protein
LKYENNNIVFCPGVEPLSSNLAERIKANCPANIFQHGAQVNYFNLFSYGHYFRSRKAKTYPEKGGKKFHGLMCWTFSLESWRLILESFKDMCQLFI